LNDGGVHEDHANTIVAALNGAAVGERPTRKPIDCQGSGRFGKAMAWVKKRHNHNDAFAASRAAATSTDANP
jgi:hypothetical protein